MADEAEIMRASHPLHGMILCCTSVEMGERNEIQNKCEKMGARHLLDLTSEVTHLICGNLFSPKYRYVSKMRPDVKVMSTQWVNAIYTHWISGEDIDPSTHEAEHRFPVLYQLKISVTGIADVADRKRIEEICYQEKASYHPDLTRDVTHLIAAAPTGKKYEFARNHNIVVVTSEWLTDSIERGMALDEQFYDPMLPPEKIGVGAKPLKTTVQAEVVELRGKRKIRKSTQDKLGGQSQSLWDDIVGQASNAKPAKRDEWEESLNIGKGAAEGSDRSDSRRSSTALRQTSGVGIANAIKGGMFASVCFWMWGFEDTQIGSLKYAVLPHEGTIVNSLEDLAAASGFIWRFVIVPRAKRIKDCPTIPEDITMVTEWWLESCLHYQKLVPPTGDFTTMPIEEFEVEEMKGMDISITKFTSIDLLYYPRLVRLLGASFHEMMRKNRSLLITNNTRGSESEKILFAHMHDIPVVTGEWLVECLKQHRRLPYEGYRVMPGESAPLLGDRFKRKADTELSSSNKKPELEAGIVEDQSRKENGGKGKQQSSPIRQDRKGESKPERRKILEGCTVCKRDARLGNVARDLGAVVLDNFDEITQLTHLVHWATSGKPLDSARDFRVATSIVGCSIVSRDWLYKCHETGERVDEKVYEMCSEAANTTIVVAQGVSTPRKTNESLQQQIPDLGSALRIAPPPPSSNQHELSPQVASASAITGPLAECSSLRINEANSSSASTRGSMEPPERKSSLSGISEILSKFGKDQLAAAMAPSNTHGKTRGRLQGKATAGKPRVFSRTPSAASVAGDVAGSQSSRAPSVSREPMELEPMDIIPSQALGYNDEETAMEKNIVRAKLDKTAPLETPRTRNRVQKPKGAVDLMPVARRSARKSSGGGGIGRMGGF
ncbi:BRCT domain-containing protein [Trichophaea hybrida]|nr:BRCT domain-containing protein [Trichophaea hybrida]